MNTKRLHQYKLLLLSFGGGEMGEGRELSSGCNNLLFGKIRLL